MGAIHFSLDPELVRALKKTAPLGCFVETGTFHGDTSEAMAALFDDVYTVELSDEIFQTTATRLSRLSNVRMFHGSSPDILGSLREELADKSVVYWLDAHWCGGVTGGAKYECPLLAELSAIGSLNAQSVVLIDDARFFISPPPAPHDVGDWPLVAEVVEALSGLSASHKLWIINDVFVFAPATAEADVVEYGRTFGIDLTRLQSDATAAAQALIARDTAIRALEQRVTELASSPPGPPPANPASGFNNAFLAAGRSEQIFAHHLGRLGISRLLDIGSNTGQFAVKMRRFGYTGAIYSVEPQAKAYEVLIVSAAEDTRWLPSVRQGTASKAGYLELNLSENSHSSSVLAVHPNHLRAEPTTRTIGQERIYAGRTDELFRPELMSAIEAVKIDVQGFEKEVLTGYGKYLSTVRLMLLEMSLVECYEGAPDLFSLDRYIVEKLGFSRISLEPSYYDDVLGVVQQYDGIYYRPDRQSAAPALGSVAVGAAITSMAGTGARLRNDGVDIGAAWQSDCVRSWASVTPQMASISEVPPPVANVTWLQTGSKPSIAEILRRGETQTADHLLLVNADIFLTGALATGLPALMPDVVYYGCRHEVIHEVEKPGTLTVEAHNPDGFDYFLLPPAFVREVNRKNLVPPDFLIGEPWWDYFIPVLSLALGFPTKKFGSKEYIALHYRHDRQFSVEQWAQNATRFLEHVAELRQLGLPYARGLLDELLEDSGGGVQNLYRVAKLVCHGLP